MPPVIILFYFQLNNRFCMDHGIQQINLLLLILNI